MSDTTEPVPATPTTPVFTPPPRRGVMLTTALIVVAFTVGLAVSGGIGWKNNDYTLFSQMLMVLNNMVVLAMGYWFGSSAGSDKKTDLLAQAAPLGTKPP